MANVYTAYPVVVDSPRSRSADWDAYCDETDGALPASIRSRGDADDATETWLVTARTEREAMARARATARRLRVALIGG